MQQVTRRNFLVGATLATSLALAGCGGGTRPGQAAAADLSAWTLTGGAEPVFKSSFKEWNDAHSDEKFSVEYFANDAFKEKIRTSVGSGNAPTLVYNWSGGTLADYVDNDSVVDLTGKVPNLEKRALPSVLESGKVDGKLYAVPNNNTQPVILYYNKKLFEQAGVPVPTTWEETLGAVKAFKQRGIIPFSLAGQSQWPMLMWIQYLTDRIGGPEVFQRVADGKPDAWSDPAITEALEKIQELVKAGAFGDTFGSVVADNNADVALVHTDKAAMLLQGSWVYSSFITDAPDWYAKGNLGYTTFPDVGGSGDQANIVGNPANFWSVSAKASEESQKAAIQFLDEINLNDTAADVMLENGMVPAVADIEDKIESHENREYLSFAYSMVKKAPNFQLSWDQALDASQAQELLTQLAQVFLGKQTPAGFTKAMNETIK